MKSINRKLGVKVIAPELGIVPSQVYRIGAGERQPTNREVKIYLRLASVANLPEADELLAHYTGAAARIGVRASAIERAIAVTLELYPMPVGRAA